MSERDDFETIWPLAERIEGWLAQQEGGLLYRYARQVTHGCIVEIGAWGGRSTVCLAYGARHAGRDVPVYAVDTWSGYAEIAPRERHGLLLPWWDANLEDAGCGDAAIAVCEDSVAVGQSWQGEKVALLFIDGAHGGEQPQRDYEAWLPHLTADAVVVFHDVLDQRFPLLQALVRRLSLSGEYRPLEVAGQCAALQRVTPAAGATTETAPEQEQA